MPEPTVEQVFAHQKEMEALRLDREIEINRNNRKLDLVRVAQATLVENSRSLPADERSITAADITAFAETLHTYVISNT